jgi:hypothetical protein
VTRRVSLTLSAIDVVLRRLSALPATREVDELRARAEEYVREADGWKVSRPSSEQREDLMKRVLALHIAVVALERPAPET